ncbi:hypothetical protein CHUAL_012793 [Chamberlinius hualienensis]
MSTSKHMPFKSEGNADEKMELAHNSEDEEEEETEGEGDENEAGGTYGEKSRRGRSVTLQMLMTDGTLEPGEGAMSIAYLGREFVADLLPDGKIFWQVNSETYSSPSAWASHCKRVLNPEKKSGCGWASIRYRGQKLDMLKTMWIDKHNKNFTDEFKPTCDNDGKALHQTKEESKTPLTDGTAKKLEDGRRPVLKHSSLGNRSSSRDPNSIVECTPFCAMGKIQPFTVTITSSSLFIMDFHCHLTTSEVVGYLAGQWDVNSHNLAIIRAYPCRSRLAEKDEFLVDEEKIRQDIDARNLMLVGWYHSHPAASVHPTLRDIDCQMEYQIKLKGDNDACYTPCVGVICSPYDKECKSLESSIQAYWVMPPPENKPHEYGKPMLMTFSIIHEELMASDIQKTMNLLFDYYEGAPDLIDFKNVWYDDITYIEKLQKSLLQKIPSEQLEIPLKEMIESRTKKENAQA